MAQQHAHERTLVIIKPDGIQRSLIGEIIKRYERVGLKLTALKLVVPSEDMARAHYMVGGEEWLEEIGRKASTAYEKRGEKSPYKTNRENGLAVLDANAKYLSASAVVVMVWEGSHAIGVVRKITGGTEPLASDVGTIRGDFTIDSYPLADAGGRSIRNLIHASGSQDEADKEIALWFKDNEIYKYRLIQEQVIYDVNLDGLLE
ncbi:MAG TPA: nucleoside-diphosphate kinase [Candidatus Paceibacterota bacterium]